MREVDPSPRTSHVTPPLECTEYPGGNHRLLGACQVQRTAQCAWLRVRRDTGVWHKAMPPPTPIPGEQPTCPGGAPPPPPSLPLMNLWGPGGVTPVYYPSGGPERFASILSSSSNGVYSGFRAAWVRVPRLRYEERNVCTLVAPPFEPSLFPVTHPAVVAVPFTRPPHPPHRCLVKHCTRCTMCVPAPAPCVAWVRAVCAS